MNQVEKLKTLSPLSYFDKNALLQLMELSENSLYADVKRWLKKGLIVQLKRGFYVTGEYYGKTVGVEAYPEFIANKLCEPSYLSTEYVLQKHGVLTEAVYAFTSVTLKTKRSFANKMGRFIYRNIKEGLFDGYEILDKNGFQIKMAMKSKALFDYLYLKLFRTVFFDEKLVASLRLNLDSFSRKDFAEFAGYCEKTEIAKFMDLPKLLRKQK